MSPQTTHQIIADINAHMSLCHAEGRQWYCGITNNINRRLFGEHNVTSGYIYRLAINHESARQIESAYHRAGCLGSHGGGDDTAVFVYAYVITPETLE